MLNSFNYFNNALNSTLRHAAVALQQLLKLITLAALSLGDELEQILEVTLEVLHALFRISLSQLLQIFIDRNL